MPECAFEHGAASKLLQTLYPPSLLGAAELNAHSSSGN